MAGPFPALKRPGSVVITKSLSLKLSGTDYTQTLAFFLNTARKFDPENKDKEPVETLQ